MAVNTFENKPISTYCYFFLSIASYYMFFFSFFQPLALSVPPNILFITFSSIIIYWDHFIQITYSRILRLIFMSRWITTFKIWRQFFF